MVAIMRKLKGLEEAEALRAVKEMNFWNGLKESKGNDLSNLLAEDPNLRNPKQMRVKR